MNKKTLVSLICAGLAGIILLIVLPQSCTVVHPNEVGIVKTMGRISHQLDRGSGLNFKAPFVQSVTKLSMSPQVYETTIDYKDDAASVTSDTQSVGYTINIVYRYAESGIEDYVTNFTKESLERQFKSNVATSINATVGKYTIYDLYGNLLEISEKTKENLVPLCKRLPIEIESVNVKSWNWSSEFDKRINETVEAIQKEKTAKANVEIERAAAQVEVAKAEASLQAEKLNAEAKKVKADAEAYEMKTKNAAIRADRDIQTLTWEHEEKMKFYEKWNGIEPGANAQIITPNYSGLNLEKITK